MKEEKSVFSEVEDLDLSNFNIDSLTNETQELTSLPDEKSKNTTVETVEEPKSNNKVEELNLDDNLENISLETTNLNEITPIPKVESAETSLETTKTEEINLAEVNVSENLESETEVKPQLKMIQILKK